MSLSELYPLICRLECTELFTSLLSPWLSVSMVNFVEFDLESLRASMVSSSMKVASLPLSNIA